MSGKPAPVESKTFDGTSASGRHFVMILEKHDRWAARLELQGRVFDLLRESFGTWEEAKAGAQTYADDLTRKSV